MIRRVVRGAWYQRVRAGLGFLYVGAGVIIIARGCFPLASMNAAKLSPLLLGAAFIGLGVLRLRDLLPLPRKSST